MSVHEIIAPTTPPTNASHGKTPNDVIAQHHIQKPPAMNTPALQPNAVITPRPVKNATSSNAAASPFVPTQTFVCTMSLINSKRDGGSSNQTSVHTKTQITK